MRHLQIPEVRGQAVGGFRKGELKLQLHPVVPLTASLQCEGVSGVRWGAFPADWQALLGVWSSRILEEKQRETEKESIKLSDGTFPLHTCCARIFLWKYGILDCVFQSQHETTFVSLFFFSVMWQEIMCEESGRKSKSGLLWFHAELKCVWMCVYVIVCVSDLSGFRWPVESVILPCLMRLTGVKPSEWKGRDRNLSLSLSDRRIVHLKWKQKLEEEYKIQFL